ncbi:hypothetical protein FRC09_011287 [Ceratobasidium sp. 395]|nr:hypothetical protein FRC09_011287 [Ceratobasidium sp. 395]
MDFPQYSPTALTAARRYDCSTPIGVLHCFNSQERSPGRHQCLELADYLVLIHEKYRAFHNGGVNQPAPQTTPLFRAPTVPLDIEQREDDSFVIAGAVAVVYKEAVAAQLREIAFLEQIHGTYEGLSFDPYSLFIYHTLNFVELPNDFINLGLNGAVEQVFHSCSAAEMFLNDTQLWLAFTPLLCRLVSSISQLDLQPSDVFTPSMVHENLIVSRAHAWYLEVHA